MTQMNLFSKQKHTHWHRDQWWLPEGWGGEGQTENLGILHLGGIPDGSNSKEFSTVQSLSRVRLFATPWTAAHQASLLITNFCHPLLLLLSIFPNIRVFSSESALLIRLPKYWSFSFSISPSNEYSRLISFRIDWFDLLVVQVTLKRLLQHHNSKASILQCLAFFMVQLSHPYMITGKTKAFTRWTWSRELLKP